MTILCLPSFIFFFVIAFTFLMQAIGTEFHNDTSPSLYEAWRSRPWPTHGVSVPVNPAPLQWRSERYWNKRNPVYNVYLSQDASFASSSALVSSGQRFCFYHPHKKLKPGTWYWKYEIVDQGKTTTMGPYSFLISEQTPVFETPTWNEFLAKLPQHHPFLMTAGQPLASFKEKTRCHPLFNTIIAKGKRILRDTPYQGAVSDENPAKGKVISRTINRELKKFRALMEAWALSGDPQILSTLRERLQVLLSWPTHDLIGAQVLHMIALGYDLMFKELSSQEREKILRVIDRQLQLNLNAWSGKIESRQVENHFWQTGISGNFHAALATVHELPISRKMLRYIYNLFLVRFPNLATQEGGWAEGPGYFGVNKSAIIDMALTMKIHGNADVFQMPWYRSLADYLVYFAPSGGAISGFGDMHDRIRQGNDVGRSEALVVGYENKDSLAMFRFYQSIGDQNNKPVSLQLNEIEPWYQIVRHVQWRPVPEPHLPQARVFYGTGQAALHSNVLHADRDTAVYFRSSPFGAKGHMHANQNCFNISRRGERLFYSTGYYTSFADPHSLTSYRHTRAHNGILVDGCGQAFGHEGYGWIKRFLNNKEIVYVCGEAAMAYRLSTDSQFLELNHRNGIANTPKWGFTDARLQKFERHLALLRPDTVVVYDVLESELPHQWTWLLHSPSPFKTISDNVLNVATQLNAAQVHVFGSNPLKLETTDQFYIPPVDFKKKYKDLPQQYHASYTTLKPSRAMRFLSIICLGNPPLSSPSLRHNGKCKFSVDGYQILAELDPRKPAFLDIQGAQASLVINPQKHTNDSTNPTAKSVLSSYQGKKHVQKEAFNRLPAQ